MLARCAKCQGDFTTDRFGLQTCPHCGSELLLSDPNAPQPPPGPPSGAPTPPSGAPGWTPPSTPDASGGGQLPPAPPPGGWGPPGGYPPPPPPGPGPELPAPFAERARLGFFQSWFETFKLIATRPGEFFARVRVDQSNSAFLFAVLAIVAGAIFQALYAALRMQAESAFMNLDQITRDMPADQAQVFQRVFSFLMGGTFPVLLFAWSVVGGIISIFIVAGIVHLLLLLFKGAPRGFGATLTVVAYAQGLRILEVVPFCGSLVASIWIIVVAIIGLGAAQRCGPAKAAAAVLLPFVIFACCCCGGLGLLAGTTGFFEHLKQAAESGTTQL